MHIEIVVGKCHGVHTFCIFVCLSPLISIVCVCVAPVMNDVCQCELFTNTIFQSN